MAEKRLSATVVTRLAPLAGILVFLAIWEVGVALYKVPAYLLPAPSAMNSAASTGDTTPSSIRIGSAPWRESA